MRPWYIITQKTSTKIGTLLYPKNIKIANKERPTRRPTGFWGKVLYQGLTQWPPCSRFRDFPRANLSAIPCILRCFYEQGKQNRVCKMARPPFLASRCVTSKGKSGSSPDNFLPDYTSVPTYGLFLRTADKATKEPASRCSLSRRGS